MNFSSNTGILFFLTALCFAQLGISNAQSYFLNGDAVELGNDCYQLTSTQTFQNGTVWYADQLDLTEPFSLEFEMNFGNSDAGADGMVFVLQTNGTNAIGENGMGIGFGGFAPSLGIEFDTYQNTNLADPPQDHISIARNGNVDHNNPNNLAGPVAAALTNIEDGLNHIIRIVWDPVTQNLEVWFDCNLRLTTSVNLVDEIFNGQNLVWWGFTGATGGEVNVQVVCLQESILSVSEEVTICAGAITELSAAGNPNGTFNWTPITGLDSPNSQTTNASPTETTTYTVTYTDFCDNEIQDEVTVTVEELEVIPEVSAILSCYEPELEISATNNFSNSVTYSWSTQDGNIVSGSSTTTPTVDSPGIYNVDIAYQNECFASAEIEVEGDFLTFSADAGNALDIDCNNPTVVLDGSTDGTGAVINWTTDDGFILEGANTLNPTVTDGGTYSLSVLNAGNGCESTDEISLLNLIEFPIADAGIADTIACLSPFGVLDGTGSSIGGEIVYQWTNSDSGVPEGDEGLVTLLVTTPGTYFLTVSNTDNGCTSVDSVSIFFDTSALIDPDAILFPNIFTPNNDSINDVFRPVIEGLTDFDLTSLLDNYQLQVFNRWGNLVYESSGRVKFWDGKLSDGSTPVDGVYFYTVRYTFICGDPREEERSGSIQILTSK